MQNYEDEETKSAIDFICEEQFKDIILLAAQILSNVGTKNGSHRTVNRIIFDLAESVCDPEIKCEMLKDYKGG